MGGTEYDDLVDAGTSTLSYNLIGNEDFSAIGQGNLQAAPQFLKGWYLDTGSLAIDGDPTVQASNLPYLAEMASWGTANGVTQATGQGDTGNADLGYHHSFNPKTADEINTLITARATNIGAGGTTIISVTPVDAQGVKLGSGQNVRVNNLVAEMASQWHS